MIYAIVGPTGIGKTQLSLAVAKHLNTEIISGDSIQVYRGLDIGSAKITTEEQQGIPHHLIDIMDPNDDFSVALYQKLVREKIADFKKRNLVPIIVGGTGLYIKSVLYDYNFEGAKRDKKIEEQYTDLTNQELYHILLEKDEAAATNIHPNNRKRVLQAIIRSSTNKISDNNNKDIPLYDFTIIGLRLNRQKLYQRINQRVDKMVEDGLVQEVKHLYDKGITSNAIQAIGYKELYRYFAGDWTLDQAIDKIKQHSRNLAKKQYTFFTHQFPVHWVDVNLEDFDKTIQSVLQFIDQTR